MREKNCSFQLCGPSYPYQKNIAVPFLAKNAEELAKIRNKKIWDDLSNLEGEIYRAKLVFV